MSKHGVVATNGTKKKQFYKNDRKVYEIYRSICIKKNKAAAVLFTKLFFLYTSTLYNIKEPRKNLFTNNNNNNYLYWIFFWYISMN